MERLQQKCSICGTVYEGDFYELRKYFTTSKRHKNGLDPRCKECKKKYLKNIVSVEQETRFIEKNTKILIIDV